MQNNSALYDNVNDIAVQLRSIGIETFSIGKIGEAIRAGVPAFDVTTFQEKGTDKTAIQCHFEKNDFDKYGLKKYRLTLYDPIALDVDRLSSSVVELDRKMGLVNWYFDLAEDIPTWTKGYKDVCQIEDELHHLSHFTNGDRLAVILWNNHVPAVAVEKPPFIQRAEKESGLYPQKIFSAETSLTDAIAQLKSYRVVEDRLSQYSILEFNDKDKKQDIIGRLLDGCLELITLEKKVVPAEHIEKYLVVVHDYPQAGDNHPQNTIKYRIKEVGSSPVFTDALKLLHAVAGETVREKPALPGWDIMVIGRYHHKELDFNFEGTPEVNTGHILATGYPTGTTKEPFRYDVVLSDDLDKKIKIHESLYVQMDGDFKNLIFSDVLKEQKEIDHKFWRNERTIIKSNDSDIQLLKNNRIRKNHKDVNNVNVNCDILSKFRDGSDKRLKR